jgi:hypothetical protein
LVTHRGRFKGNVLILKELIIVSDHNLRWLFVLYNWHCSSCCDVWLQTSKLFLEASRPKTHFQTILLLDLSPCFYVWGGMQCFSVNVLFLSVFVAAYGSFHIGLLLERCYVAFGNSRSRGIFGGILGALIAVSEH